MERISNDKGKDKSRSAERQHLTDQCSISTDNDTEDDLDLEAQTQIGEEAEEEVEDSHSRNRRRWLTIARLLTCCVPECWLMRCTGNVERAHARREKLAFLSILILMSLFFLALYILTPIYACPESRDLRLTEIHERYHNEQWMILNGYILDVGPLFKVHPTPSLTLWDQIGLDVSHNFNGMPFEDLPPECGFSNNSINEDYERYAKTQCNGVTINNDTNELETDTSVFCHPYQDPQKSKYYYGRLTWTWEDLALLDRKEHWIVIDGLVFNTTRYVNGGYHFLDEIFELVIKNRDKTDATGLYYYYFKNPSYLECYKALFYAGKIDTKSYTACFATNVLLFSFLVLVAFIVLIKFFAAILTIGFVPPKLKKRYVIINVPCYTEGMDSMEKTINSVVQMDYPATHKLLFIVCDGMVTGQGNSKSTPEIVLDILKTGDDEMVHGVVYPYNSLEGENGARVYAGFYHQVPYIVIVKEKNRGKRDSQIILLSFLNKLFYQRALNPLETRIKQLIEQTFQHPAENYEYLMSLDADTNAHPDSLKTMVYRMDEDPKILAASGETRPANKWESIVTVIQVYEYWLSYNLSKAFESLFNNVTCLPGCFSIFRIKYVPRKDENGKRLKFPKKERPKLIDDRIIGAYSNRNVDNLHTKNLLQLGEDRYLSVLLIRFFPDDKFKYFHEAKCTTLIPSVIKVLLSQRRRWQNSSLHSLYELLNNDKLRGIGPFSFKTIVLIELISMFLLPASVLYIGYLLYTIITGTVAFPIILIISLAIIFGTQVALIIIKADYSYLFWFVIYILAMPFWFFVIPIYGMLHADRNNWGSTRKVQGS